MDLSWNSCDDSDHTFFCLVSSIFFFIVQLIAHDGLLFPKITHFHQWSICTTRKTIRYFSHKTEIPSEPSSPMLRLLAQTFERMISQKKRNRGIKRRRLLQNVTPLLTSSETHSSWSKQTNKREKKYRLSQNQEMLWDHSTVSMLYKVPRSLSF